MAVSDIFGLIALAAGAALTCVMIWMMLWSTFQWKDKPPTEPGLYYYRRDPDSTCRGCIVKENDDGELFGYLTGYERQIRINSMPDSVQWVGPIPEPVDKPEWMKYFAFL